MSIIYEPTGKAREYSPLACNLYSGCNHGCIYCYAPNIRRMNRKDYLDPIPRKNILRLFEKECKTYYKSKLPILFCFMSDPYNSEEKKYKITQQALEICLKYKIPVKILTKSESCLRDTDLFKKFENHIAVGMTLTFDNASDSFEWESMAAYPEIRLSTLKLLHTNNIKTWASIEPVIFPKQSLNMIEKSLPYVDFYKIGKLNNFKGMDKKINWTDFLLKVITILRSANKKFYIKYDLRENAKSIELNSIETQIDNFAPDVW